MGRAPCCDKANVKKGPWSPEEDTKLKEFIDKYGTGGNWIALPQKAGLKRCGKSCRLRWLNYLRPNIKHGEFSHDEDRIICSLFASIGSRWSIIAGQLPGRTDNDIKNYWNTKLKKKLLGIAPSQRKPHQQQQNHQQHHLPFPSSFETTIAPSSSSQGSCYTAPKSLLTGLEAGFTISPDHILNTVATTTSNPSLLQGPMHQYHMKEMKETGSLIMFGGDQHSCSSSDGSCTQISYGKEIEYEYGAVGHMGFESYHPYGGLEETQKLLLGNNNNGIWGDVPLEYGYDEIKQLVSPNLYLEDPSNASTTKGSYKSQGRVMYYY